MKSLLLILAVVVCIFPFSEVAAQHYTNQNKTWAFGANAGLDFRSGSPVPIATSINTSEGCASVSDSLANLLFYTDGKAVYNASGSVMPHGSSIVSFGTSSTSQAALIVPVIGNPSQYYVFSMQYLGGGTTCNMAYSIVDMRLDGGSGDIIITSMGKAVNDLMAEKMIAVTGNHNNIWVITHKKDSAEFLAYNINSAGLDTFPVVSRIGTFSGHSCYGLGVIKASPNRRKVVSQSYDMGSDFGTELYDFNPEAGTFSNCFVLDSFTSQYGAEFSADNTKLYTQQAIGQDSMKIWQYDISLSNASAIRGSKVLIANIKTTNASDLKLAPDNRIYFYGEDDSLPAAGLGYSRYLDCIRAPNFLGSVCGYLPHVVTFASATGMKGGLPNLFVTTDTINRVIVNELMVRKPIVVYPNPASLSLTIISSESIASIAITDLIGQVVYSNNYHNEEVTVNIADLPNGMYFVRINGSEVRKFAKQ